MSKRLGGIKGCKYKTSSWHLNGFVVILNLLVYCTTVVQYYVVANPVRGLLDRKRSEEHLPSSNESKRKTQTNKKRRRKRNKNNSKMHMPEKDKRRAFDRESVWHSASREPSDTLPGSQPCTQTRSIYHIPYSQGFSFH